MRCTLRTTGGRIGGAMTVLAALAVTTMGPATALAQAQAESAERTGSRSTQPERVVNPQVIIPNIQRRVIGVPRERPQSR